MTEQAMAGAAGPREITVDANLDRIEPVTEFVNAWLEERGCPERLRIQLDVVIDEIFGNIIRYAYGEETGSATVRVSEEENPGIIRITFTDQGIPFNPLEKKMPDVTGLRAKERPIGGLGLFMVKKTMDSVTYDYLDGKNILTILKRIR